MKKQWCLPWVVMAKNCLTNQNGFSPNELVFGRNPILPNVTKESGYRLTSLERGQEEELVRDSLNAMHKAREVYIRNESCNKLRIAMKKKIREHTVS